MKDLWVFNEGGRHLTISYIPWKWLRIWINFGYPRTFSWGVPPKQPWDTRESRDISAVLRVLEIDVMPLTLLLRRANEGVNKTSN